MEPVAAPDGVDPVDCGMGGSDSNSEAPNEDDGLNALIPENPVVCGCMGDIEMEGAEVPFVVPVAWLEKPVNESDKFDVVVLITEGEPDVDGLPCDVLGFQSLLNVNEVAMLDMCDPPGGLEGRP